MILFPLDQFWWLYLTFLGVVTVVLLLDLGVFHRKAHQPSFTEASLWTVVWVALAGIVNLGIYQYVLHRFGTDPALLPSDITATEIASKVGLEFLTGYVVEKTLAIDNLFVFAMVFSYFRVKPEFQHKVLFWGIIGAVLFRGIFIALGSFLMQYHWMVIVFGVFLMLTGIKMAVQTEEGDLEDRWIMRTLKRVLPLGPDDEAGSFFRRENGVLVFTPLFLALMVIEFSDIVFAVDSVPAIFALTDEPFIVFTSNIMAILGLRSMYFMLAGFMDRFVYIKYGLAAVLVFVGLKMSWLNELFGGKFPVTWSLLIIAILVSTSIVASLVRPRSGPLAEATRSPASHF